MEFPTALASACLGALVGGLTTTAVNIFKAKMDIYASRYEDVCKQIIAAADLSAEYWLLSLNSDETAAITEEQKKLLSEGRLMEARIEGFQQLVLLADEDLRDDLPSETRSSIARKLPNFIDSMTGDDFKARGGNAKVVEASIVQYSAADLVSEIRAGLRRRYTYSHFVKHVFSQH